MTSTSSFVLVPRCVPFDPFREYVRKIREHYQGHRLVIFEANPDNLQRYAKDITVIPYKGKSFLTDEMRAQLREKVDWNMCAAIVIPLSNQDGAGFEQLLRFAREAAPTPAFAMTPDLSPRLLSGRASSTEPASSLLIEERHVSACHQYPDGTVALVGWIADPGAQVAELTIQSSVLSAPIPAAIFRYPHPDLKSSGNTSGIAIFTACKVASEVLWVRNSTGSMYELSLKSSEPDPIALLNEFVKAFNGCQSCRGLSSSEKSAINKYFFKVFESLNAKANEGIKIAEEFQIGVTAEDPQVSIVIPIFRAQELIRHQLSDFSQDAFLKKQQLILVYGSVEGEEDDPARFKLRMHRLFELYQVPCKVLVTSRNCGFALACNLGAARAEAPYLLLLNSDIFPKSKNWLQTLVSGLEEDNSIGIVGARLLYPDESVQHVGLTWKREPSLQNLLINIHPFKGMNSAMLPFNDVREVHAVTGACMMFRTKEYRSEGMLDTGFIIGDYEDSDICLRFRAKGRKIVCDNRAELYHLEGASFRPDLRRALFFVNACRHEERWGKVISSLIESSEGRE